MYNNNFQVDYACPGFCSKCHTEIANFRGSQEVTPGIYRPKIESLKANFRQQTVELSNNSQMMVPLCETCFNLTPEDLDYVMASEVKGWQREVDDYKLGDDVRKWVEKAEEFTIMDVPSMNFTADVRAALLIKSKGLDVPESDQIDMKPIGGGALVSKPFTFSAGAVIIASQHNSNFDTLYNLVNGSLDSTNLASNAAIADTQLGQITTAGKVSGAALTSLSSIPSGAGIIPSANLPAATGGTLGSFKNLAGVWASNSTVTYTATVIVLEDSSNNARIVRSLNCTISSGSNGAVNTLDAGTVAANTIYYVWAISNGSIDGGLLSTSGTAPTLPSGYTYKVLMGVAGTNNSSNFIKFHQTGRNYNFDVWGEMATGNPGIGSWTSITMTPANMTTSGGFIPSSLSDLGYGSISASDAAGGYVAITNDNTVSLTQSTLKPNTFSSQAGGANLITTFWRLNLITANTLYWSTGGTTEKVYLMGFEINKIT